MNKPFFTQRPLRQLLGLALFAGVILPSYAQIVPRTTDKSVTVTTLREMGTVDATEAATRNRLARALPSFWASTEPGKAYMILDTLVRRATDGRVMWVEKERSFPFGPDVTPTVLMTNAPTFVSLLLGQYATQDRVAQAAAVPQLVRARILRRQSRS